MTQPLNKKRSARFMQSLTRTLTLAFAITASFTAPVHATTPPPTRSAQHLRPDALLQIDLSRASVVDKIIDNWKSEIPAAQIGAFRSKLSALRADQLLAANVSGSFDSVLEIVHSHSASATPTGAVTAAATPALGSAQSFYATQSELKNTLPAAQSAAFANINSTDTGKALGDAAADLVYTPVTPCRLFDTRTGQVSALGTVGGQFSNQQTKTITPAGACGIPTTGVASLFLSFHAFNNNPALLGVIGFMKPAAPFSALAATWTGANWATGTYITQTNPNGSFDAFVGNGAAMTANMVVDVMGYFTSPTRNGDGLRIVTLPGGADIPNVINGDDSNTIITTSGGMRGATISGGRDNIVGDQTGDNGNYGTIGGGLNNRVGLAGGAGGNYATVSGGDTNTASGGYSTVAGGGSNTASGGASIIAGGFNNLASGIASTVAAGSNNRALGQLSFAAGNGATASDASEFVWNGSGIAWNPKAQGLWGGNTTSTFNVKADRGIYFQAGASTGCTLAAGGTGWFCASDRSLKDKFNAVSPRAVLEKVAQLPITTWVIKGYDQLHMGPMAQDFRKAFGLGRDDVTINSTDAQGVALAAIQGLNQKLEAEAVKSKAKDAKILELEKKAVKVDALERANDAMQLELAAIKKKLGL
jgi:hypothetical protein